jgi:hypothetical protein
MMQEGDRAKRGAARNGMRGSTYVNGRVQNALPVPTRQSALFQFPLIFVEN